MKLLWLDLETTGLDRSSDLILEIAAVITDESLVPEAAFQSVVKVDMDVALALMDEEVRAMHESSGLLKEVAEAELELRDVERAFREFLHQHLPQEGDVHLAGNSVHFDRDFLRRDMQPVEMRLHHRHLDISAVRLFTMLMDPRLELTRPNRATKHRALTDLFGCIEEARHYQKALGTGLLRADSIPVES